MKYIVGIIHAWFLFFPIYSLGFLEMERYAEEQITIYNFYLETCIVHQNYFLRKLM